MKIYLVLEKQWAHGCCHIGFPKSCYDGKHASVSDVSRWVEVKKITRVKLRIVRTNHQKWRWETVPSRIAPVGRDQCLDWRVLCNSIQGLSCTEEETVLYTREASGVMQQLWEDNFGKRRTSRVNLFWSH